MMKIVHESRVNCFNSMKYAETLLCLQISFYVKAHL